MDLIWIVPVAVLVVGGLPVLFSVARLSAELTALRGDLRNWSAVRPALVEVRSDADALRRRAALLRATRR